MNRLADFFWPTLEHPTLTELNEDNASEADDIAAIRMEGWARSPDLALEQAHRFADSEEDRRRETEGKASTYLLFAAAFAAALIPFLPIILEGKTDSAPRWLIAVILIIATAYLIAAGIWAFRALRVCTYHRLDTAELLQIWQRTNPTRTLIRETLAATRMNYRAVNDKVSCVKMVHEFMVRSFVAFGVLVVVESGGNVIHSAAEAYGTHAVIDKKGSSKPPEVTPHGPGSPVVPPPNSGAQPQSTAKVSGTTKPKTISEQQH